MFKRPTIAKPMKIAPTEAMNDTQKSSTEKKQNRVLLIVAVVLSALSYHKMDSLTKEQTVVIVPYGAKSADLLITGESASAGYVKLLARLIVADWGSVSKASVDDKSAELLGLVYMDRVEDMRKSSMNAQNTSNSLIAFLRAWKLLTIKSSLLLRIQKGGHITLLLRKSINSNLLRFRRNMSVL